MTAKQSETPKEPNPVRCRNCGSGQGTMHIIWAPAGRNRTLIPSSAVCYACSPPLPEKPQPTAYFRTIIANKPQRCRACKETIATGEMMCVVHTRQGTGDWCHPACAVNHYERFG